MAASFFKRKFLWLVMIYFGLLAWSHAVRYNAVKKIPPSKKVVQAFSVDRNDRLDRKITIP